VQREVRPESLSGVHEDLSERAEPIAEQVARLRSGAERLLRRHGEDVRSRQWQQQRLSDSAADIYAQVATLSRTTAVFTDQGVDASGQERFIAETFCGRAARRVDRRLRQLDANDDERMHSIARVAYNRGGYDLTTP
jgi:acyl-CoA dehydrogenase family protein 9